MTPDFLVNRMKGIREDAAQLIRDVQYWNKNRTDAAPMDCEVERVIVGMADKALAAAAAGDHGEYSRISTELSDYATRAIPGVGS